MPTQTNFIATSGVNTLLDLSGIFADLDGGTSYGTATNFRVGSFDLTGYFHASTSQGDRPSFNTGYKITIGGTATDLSAVFRRRGFSGINITAQPQPATVLETQTAQFTITATGSGTLLYQWQKYNTGTATWDNLTNLQDQISGAQSATLQILNADYPTDEGSYKCVLTDNNGSQDSNTVTLTVNYLPVITTDPISNIYNDNDAVSYTVVATEGKPSGLTYKWQRLTTDIGAVWTDLSTGSETDIGISYTTANLTFRCQLARADYQYRCIVSNSVGSDTSNAAKLYINPKFNTNGNLPPTNSATVGSGASNNVAYFTVNAGGSAILKYQWYKKLSGGSFTAIGDSNPTFADTVDEVSNGAQYYCVITSRDINNVQIPGTTTLTSATCTLTVNLTPISITSLLGNSAINPTVTEGESLQYIVSASGSGTLNYAFYRRAYTSRPSVYTDTLVQNSALNTYSHNVTLAENDNDFFCAVSSSKTSLGTVNSSLSTLTIRYVRITGGTINGINYLLSIGNGANYNVTTSAFPAVNSYSWRKDGILATTASSYSFTINASSAATYSVEVGNGFRTATASSILYIQPYITTHPQSGSAINAGQSKTFTVVAGGSFITYQWELSTNSGGSWSAIGGANSASYTVSNATSSQNGYQYRCVISNSSPANNVPNYPTINQTSQAATLTVNFVATIGSVSVDGTTVTSNLQQFSIENGTSFNLSASSINYGNPTASGGWYRWGGQAYSDFLSSSTSYNLTQADNSTQYYRFILNNSAGAGQSLEITITTFNPDP
jgi:hypothetical protein